MTNKEKFEEVFGFEPTLTCLLPHEVCDTVDGLCFECPFGKFWEKEYKSCFKLDKSKLGAKNESK